MKFYNLTPTQYVTMMRHLAGRFDQSRPSLGPDFGSKVTEKTNQDVCEWVLDNSIDYRGFGG